MASSGRRRVNSNQAEDEAFSEIAKEAEARLAARRQARAEAREIRMKELERLQKEADEQSDRQYELLTDSGRTPRPPNDAVRTPSYVSCPSSYASSCKSIDDFTDSPDLRPMAVLSGRDIKQLQFSDLEDKFRRAMVSNAQLDNERSAYIYQVETLKDEIEETSENMHHHQRDYRDKKRQYDQLVRDHRDLQMENQRLMYEVKKRDQLIKEKGLVLIEENGEGGYNGDISNEGDSTRGSSNRRKSREFSTALLSKQCALLIEEVGNGSLDVRLKKFLEERQELIDEIYRLRLDLEEERQKSSKMENSASHNHVNGIDAKVLDVQREASKQLGEYKFRLKNAEQEITTLQSNICRLESQVARYKTATEDAEKTEDELKAEKRRVMRELREAQNHIEELETSNVHLQKRIDKLKSARNALIKS